MSVSTENFIKAIYNLNEKEEAKTGSIAQKLNITHSATTDMAKNLAKKNYIKYQKYQALQLTKEGKDKALQIIRKHRLWELFLYKTLNLSLEEVHHEAELLEHQTSNFLLNALDKYLEYPKFDPHGDPIPDNKGKLPIIKNILNLSESLENKIYKIVRLNSSDTDFFTVCKNYHLLVDTNLKVIKNYASMVEFKIKDKIIVLPHLFSQNIYVILI